MLIMKKLTLETFKTNKILLDPVTSFDQDTSRTQITSRPRYNTMLLRLVRSSQDLILFQQNQALSFVTKWYKNQPTTQGNKIQHNIETTMSHTVSLEQDEHQQDYKDKVDG